MEKRTRKIRTRKRKGKIKITESARLVEKNDKTRVASRDTIGAAYREAPTVVVLPNNAATFKIKLKKKR